ncbi:hypothetical protein [Mycobacterium sp. 236(2023)]|uniref:hypothetical protein n=1 Tax=Mycobacterium sp. 236(2023) TaxID=3038163 RepID=UPI002414EB4C|nr:hypothetical protein [Mycobacterium sp. 236(2023)]MDG4669367.1 hypothetical protein [Mycobacterium sp. 236(2023)]
MDLRWWPILVAGLLCLIVGAVAAWQLPVERIQRNLRPLAHVDRLTRLPEFARVQRIYVLSIAATTALLATAFLAAIVAAARPVELAADDNRYDTTHPRDIMLCVGQPVTDPTTADLLNFYADQAKAFTNQSLGITSPNQRVMPLTRDRGYAEQRLRYFADMARIQQDLDTRKDVPIEQRLELAAGIDSFARAVTYVDYAPSIEDALALCMSGFPDFATRSEHRRQVVYVGYSQWRTDDETRPPLYDSGQIQAMAQEGGIQINAISRADVAETSTEDNDLLREFTEATGGTFELYNPAGTAGGDAAVLTDKLTRINDNPSGASRAGTVEASPRNLDAPQTALAVAVIAAALLSISLVVLRR